MSYKTFSAAQDSLGKKNAAPKPAKAEAAVTPILVPLPAKAADAAPKA